MWDARAGVTSRRSAAATAGVLAAAALERSPMSADARDRGSGYIATHLVADLLRDGLEVRTTVRSLSGEAGAACRRTPRWRRRRRPQVVVADLARTTAGPRRSPAWTEVHHVASPDPRRRSRTTPTSSSARRATAPCASSGRPSRAGARRVVLTSSFAAVGYSPKAVPDFTEADWTDPDTPDLPPYPRSKTIAERAAWDFMAAADGGTELVVVNPTGVFGPTLTTRLGSSMQIVKAMLDGTMPVAPRARFGVADVRDVADLHRRAMAAPAAAGRRFLAVGDDPATSFVAVAAVLREHLGTSPRTCPPRRRPARTAGAGHPQRPCAHRAGLAPAAVGGDDRGLRPEPARPRPDLAAPQRVT